MVPHWLKIAIQTLHDTENMANTGPLYRLFQLSTHFLQIEGNGKEGKVHFDLVFSKMSESFVAVISLHLPKDRLWFDAPTTLSRTTTRATLWATIPILSPQDRRLTRWR